MRPTILVSGCTKGIGLSVVWQFAQQGFNVAGCARNEQDLKDLFTQLSMKFPKQQFFMEVCDVSKTELLKVFAADVLNEFKQIDVLFNNAGVFMPGSILEEDEGAFEKQYLTNVSSAYYLCRIIGGHMVKRGFGHIFNVCSTASITSYTNGGSYAISKYAMFGLNQSLREELKTKKVKVTALLPGATLTNSWNGTNLPPERFIPATDIAKLVWNTYDLSPQTNVEEILVRPIEGDI
ncbi:MAG: SDR family oxidoreductase [Bacteroidia bacterium]|jgi:short-subunit dehydrogenase|nr:SDR family oxidoreductase [Bacteroidia bacterium]